MRAVTFPLALALASATIVDAQTTDVTLGSVIDQVATYTVSAPGWTEYRRQKEAEQLKERVAGGTISFTVNVDPRLLTYDKGRNASILKLGGVAYEVADNSPLARQRRETIGRMAGQFVDASGRSAPTQVAEFETIEAGDWLLRIYNRRYYRSLRASQAVLNLLTRGGPTQLSLQLTVASPSDRWMMEVNGITATRVLGRVKRLDWGPESVSMEVEEISSTFAGERQVGQAVTNAPQPGAVDAFSWDCSELKAFASLGRCSMDNDGLRFTLKGNLKEDLAWAQIDQICRRRAGPVGALYLAVKTRSGDTKKFQSELDPKDIIERIMAAKQLGGSSILGNVRVGVSCSE
jgi:hypothetical protein